MQEQRKPGPPLVGWEITSQCNLTCPHCFSAAAKRPHDEMGTEECREVVKDMARIGVGHIGWTGGEPLLRQDLEELIALAKSLGMKSSITTNGVPLDEKRALSLKEAGNHAIQISLDGSTPEQNYKMRRTTEEEFYKIIEAIEICRKHNIKLFLATLLGRENLHDAPEMVKIAKKAGLTTIRFCGFTPVGRGKRADVRERLEFNRHMLDLMDFVKKLQKDRTIIPMYDPGFGPVPPTYHFHECIAGKETFYLKGNGDIYPCTSLLHRKFKVGNIRERSLEEIWNDPAIEEMSVFPRETIHGPCRDCDIFDRCHGACRGAAFAHTGDISASFPVCLYQVARQAMVGK